MEKTKGTSQRDFKLPNPSLPANTQQWDSTLMDLASYLKTKSFLEFLAMSQACLPNSYLSQNQKINTWRIMFLTQWPVYMLNESYFKKCQFQGQIAFIYSCPVVIKPLDCTFREKIHLFLTQICYPALLQTRYNLQPLFSIISSLLLPNDSLSMFLLHLRHLCL